MNVQLQARAKPISKLDSHNDRSVVLAGIGIAQPRYSISQNDAAEIAKTFIAGHEEQIALLPTLYRMSRVRQRGSVLLESDVPGEKRQSFFPPVIDNNCHGPSTAVRMQKYANESLPLAVEAATQALADSCLGASDITHLITASCTGFDAPGVDIGLVRRLGLRPDVARFHIGFMGCHSAINAMRLAKALVQADPDANVLVCCVELCSLHNSYGWDPEKIVANALFADGAGAMVFRDGDQSNERSWQLSSVGSCLIDDSEDAMNWRIGDHGFEMGLSPQVPHIIEQSLHGWVSQWLEQQQLTIDKINSWAIHPGGPKIVRSAANALGLSDDQISPSMQILAQHGNMSSATLIFILKQLLASHADCPTVGMAFGPGLVVEACLFE